LLVGVLLLHCSIVGDYHSLRKSVVTVEAGDKDFGSTWLLPARKIASFSAQADELIQDHNPSSACPPQCFRGRCGSVGDTIGNPEMENPN